MRKYLLLALSLLVSLLGAGCAMPAAPDCTRTDVFCVGLVTDVGRLEDRAFNQSAWEALKQAKTEGIVDWAQYIETVNSQDFSRNIQVFAKAGYDVIVTSSLSLGQATMEAAISYPDILFIAVDQPAEEFTPSGEITPANYVGLVFPYDHAGFLAGALAALTSETHRIGAVLSTDEEPAMAQLGTGFQAGAAYVDDQMGTTTEVHILYHSDVPVDEASEDANWGAATAADLVKQGVDVLFGAGERVGESALIAAAQQGAYVIGADIDQYYRLPVAAPRMLSSVVKLVTPGVYEMIRMAVEGNFPGGANFLGNAGYAPYHDLADKIPTETKVILEKIFYGLKDGTIQVEPSAEPDEQF